MVRKVLLSFYDYLCFKIELDNFKKVCNISPRRIISKKVLQPLMPVIFSLFDINFSFFFYFIDKNFIHSADIEYNINNKMRIITRHVGTCIIR